MFNLQFVNVKKSIDLNFQILPVRKELISTKLGPSVIITGKVLTAAGKKKFSTNQWPMPSAFVKTVIKSALSGLTVFYN